MKVYRGKKVQTSNGNLVGIIYSSGEVYQYSNGEEKFFGFVRNNKFYASYENSELFLGITNNVKTSGTNEILVPGENDKMEISGFEYYGSYYSGDDTKYKSDNIIGWATGGGASSINTGRFVAAYYLILLGK